MNHKDMLAKLLAEENISILREAVSTASFDILERVLRLPVWANLSENIEDLLISHEIAHAKYTDPYWFIREDIRGLKHLILNIVEDNRIERFIKIEYPIFKGIYKSAYDHLFDDGFFGEEFTRLIDKINVYSKVGTYSGVVFTPEEEIWFDKVNSTQTPEDVLRVMEELYEYTKEELEKENKVKGDQAEPGTDPGPKVTEGDVIEESCYTKFEKELDSLADTTSKYNNFETDNKFNFYKNVIVPHKKIIEDSRHIKLSKEEMEGIAKFEAGFDDFMSFTKMNVNVMVKEFEMRKSSSEYRRRQQFKTGELNMSKMFSYQISDNIFKTKSIVKEGKNHGMVILLDWSGSMTHIIDDCIDQIINLVLFCNKVKIPYRVYAFTDIPIGERKKLPSDNKDLIKSGVHLLELFTNEMTKNDSEEMMRILRSNILLFDKHHYHLGGTPLNASLLYINDILHTFKRNYKVEKTSLVLISDGDDTMGLSMSTDDYNPIDGHKKIINTIRDSITKLRYVMSNDRSEIMNNILNMIRDRNKNSTIMFYLSNGEGEVEDRANNLELEKIKVGKYLSQYKSKYIDKYFFIDKNNLKIEDDKKLDYTDYMLYNKEIRIMLSELIKEFA